MLKMKPALFAAINTLAITLIPMKAQSQELLTGDRRLACEAILCLSSSTRPSECSPSWSRYFSINKKKFSDTLKARASFLSLCPIANQTPAMASLVTTLTNGAGRCDANTLNTVLRQAPVDEFSKMTIGNSLPDYCTAYFNHQYTDHKQTDTAPKYVGTPEQGGYWVESKDHSAALDSYKSKASAQEMIK